MLGKVKAKGITLFLLLFFSVAVLFGAGITPKKVKYRYFRGQKNLLRVTFMDVGQGDAELIQTPSGKVILIDGGNGGNRYSRIDYGKKVVVPYLKLRGIKKIDIMIASHPHADHIGGLIYVLKTMPVSVVYDAGLDYPSPVYRAFLKEIDRSGAEYKIMRTGDKLDFGPGVKVTVLNPSRIYRNVNNNSITFKMTYKAMSFLFTGDIEREAENDILYRAGNSIQSFFIKVPHHGSRTSIVPEFLDAVNPTYAVISVGRNNSFGHPNARMLEAYADRNVMIFRTDYQGNIDVKTDGVHYGIKTFPLRY